MSTQSKFLTIGLILAFGIGNGKGALVFHRQRTAG